MGDDANRIQQLINNHVADIPLFYGDTKKDTIKASIYVDRIELYWSIQDAFTYFQNYVRGEADDWLKN